MKFPNSSNQKIKARAKTQRRKDIAKERLLRFSLRFLCVLASLREFFCFHFIRNRRLRLILLPSFFTMMPFAALAQEFTFVRVQWETSRQSYGFAFRGDGPLWAHDYPVAEQNLHTAVTALTCVPMNEESKILRLDEEELFEFPFLYICEVGYWALSDREAEVLREYLLRGGFLLVDDFRSTFEWSNFEEQIRRVLPDSPLQRLTIDHPIFHCFFDFEHLLEYAPYGGLEPRYYAILDKAGRIMVLVNYNNDIGDGWEWPESDRTFSTEAFRLAINYIVYAMTH
jgi:hypothetical protein